MNLLSRFGSVLMCIALLALAGSQDLHGEVKLVRAPDGGFQPQAAAGSDGTLHLIYCKGDPSASDIYYTFRLPGAAAWEESQKVNSLPGSAIPVGTVRGPHLSLGRNDRVHVVWMSAEGGGEDEKRAMYYTRMTQGKFEPQRNVISSAYGLDGGGSVAADKEGNVYVVWHAGEGEEEDRRVYVAQSTDEGKTFGKEAETSDGNQGACGCCGIRAVAGSDARYVLYRTAREEVHRDAHLIVFGQGKGFKQVELGAWELGACPMTTASLLPDEGGVTAAWETDGQVYFGRFTDEGDRISGPISAMGEGDARKHPVLARNHRGEILLAWTDGTGWERGGSFGWQMYEGDGKPIGDPGAADGVPVWSLVAAFADPTGAFVIVH